LSWGAGPRAGQFLLLAAKARALLHGRLFVSLDDIDALAPAVLRHRLVPNFTAEAEGVTVDQIIDKLLMIVPRGEPDRLL
jgi:MoxR-like ATPase